MAFNNIEYGFRVGTSVPIDDRFMLTKEEMRDMSDLRMPESYFAVCLNDNKLYVYRKNNERLIGPEDTGRFRIATPDDHVTSDVLVNLRNNRMESVIDAQGIANIKLPFTVQDGMVCAVFEE